MGRQWELPRTSKKIKCPGCGKMSFKPYVYTDDGTPIDEYKFGRCDKQNKCEYDEKPKPEDLKPGHTSAKKHVYVNEVIYPGDELLKDLHRKPSPLHIALEKKGIPLEYLYDEGVLTTNSGLTAYVFRDITGKICNVKYFKYKADGKRDHAFNSFSLKQPEQTNPMIRRFYPMPLFGEHELAADPDKKKIVCVVESEKSKVIAKWFYRDKPFIFQGCGSANGLSDGTEETTDKITPLKGRTVYWVNDNDAAARGKMRTDDKGKEIWVDCSSIRNGKKYLQNAFHIADLFTDKPSGYDIGDACLDGLKIEIKPTWSSYQTDKRYQSYVPPSDYRVHKDLASQVGETSGISDEFDTTYSWMRTHVNGFYGWSNDGKGVMLDYLSLVKSKKNGWKHCFVKKEDMGAYFDGGKSKITADRIYAKQAWTLTGQVPPPFAVYAKKHNLPVMPDDLYHESMEWVKKHFFILDPSNMHYKNIFDEFLFFHEVLGCDHYGLDPWNTVLLDEMARGDERLVVAFVAGKEFVLKTNSVMSIVNHARSMDEVKEKSGPNKGMFKVVTQFMQLGGSPWDMKMDGQFSTHRPYRHKYPNDPRVHFYNLKQRDSEIVGAERGVYKKIEFDKHKRQYYFDGINPIDGSTRTPMPDEPEQITRTSNEQQQTSTGWSYTPSWHKGKKSKSFDQHVQQDWAQPKESDEPPFG